MKLINLIKLESAELLEEKIKISKNLSDGRDTAGHDGANKKKNKQLLPDNDDGKIILSAVREAIMKNREISITCFPKQLYALMANVYDKGDEYQTHVDVPWMGDQFKGWTRADFSFTLFLSDPKSYKGGELNLLSDPPVSVKGLPGQLFLYRSGVPHEVASVKSGRRVCVVGWIQSFIKDDNLRETCTKLEHLIQKLSSKGDQSNRDLAKEALHNLLRMAD
jgi:PKHD-type hydroxylase